MKAWIDRMNGNRVLYLILYPTLIIAVVTLVVQFYYFSGRLLAPAAATYQEQWVTPVTANLCPGEYLEGDVHVFFGGGDDILFIVESIWNNDTKQTVVAPDHPQYAVQTHEQGSILKHLKYLIPQLPPGNYTFARGIGGLRSDTDVVRMYFTIRANCP